MRYTTVIDISEITAVYRNTNARILYLHMVLKSGYHDDDRDILDMSIRRLSYSSGLSVSATRHALQVLEKNNLIRKQGSVYVVRKFLEVQDITPRVKTARQQKAIEAAAERRHEQERRAREDAIERQRRENLKASGKTDFMIYYEGLIERAEAGDTRAQELVRRHRQTYEEQKQKVANERT